MLPQPHSLEEPESTTPPPSRLERWILLVLRLTSIGLIQFILIRLQLPLLEDWLPVKNILVAAASIVLAGKCLYDTLFYDRYWP